ncbi:MAG: hypothetical protein WB588_03435 [Dehalococcoidia bacterium]
MFKVFGLLLILVLAFCVSFIPHIGYAYPLHVDEWMHMTYAETIAQTGSITFPDPFTGLTNINLGDNLWVGFHILWAMFQQVSGIDWITLFRYFPSIIFMITVLAVYVLASRQGYGLEAAFFTCLIPTTGGLLGPAFMVPMALGMLFIPLSLFLAFNIKRWPSYLLIFLFTCFLLISHATTAVVLCIVLAPCILLNIRDNKWHSAGVLAALALPFVLSLPWTFQIAAQAAGRLLVPQYFSPYIELPDLAWKYGLLPIAFSFIGLIILIIKGSKKGLALILGLALLLVVMVIFYRFHHGLSTIYERGLTVMLLILSILAGAGLMWLRGLTLPSDFLSRHGSSLFRSVAMVFCVLLIVVMLGVAIPTRVNASFYHMIDDEDYRAFTWIKDNIGQDYRTATLDPWKATAFSALTGKNAVHRIWIYQEPADDLIYKFLEHGCGSSTFLTVNKVSFIYNLAPCVNPDLAMVRSDIYISNPNISNSFAKDTTLFKNPGFEQVTDNPPGYWYTSSRNCVPAFLYPEPGRNNGWSVGIEVPKAPSTGTASDAIWLQNVPVQQGRSYTIGGWVKTYNVEGQNGVMIMPGWQGPGYQWISATEFMPYLKGTNDWSYYQGIVTAPPGATICSIYCLLSNCSGQAWFDDLIFDSK